MGQDTRVALRLSPLVLVLAPQRLDPRHGRGADQRGMPVVQLTLAGVPEALVGPEARAGLASERQRDGAQRADHGGELVEGACPGARWQARQRQLALQ